MSEKKLQVDSPVKVITSGTKPTTENLPKGSIAVGRVNNRLAAVAALGDPSEETEAEIQDLLQYDTVEGENATVTDLGGIKAGTKASDLKGKPLSEVLDALLFPVVEPTFVAPTATLTLDSSVARAQEVGAVAPTADKFTHSFNKGSINIAGKKVNDRAGAETAFALSCNDGSIPTKFDLAKAYRYKGRVSYAQGPQPKDSKGNDVGSPLTAGAVATTEVVVNAVYPYFANTKSAAELTKQPLTTINYIEVSCVSENSQNRHAFALPATYNVTKIEYFDTVANKYNPMATSDFTGVVYSQTVQGNSVQYKKYSRNTQGLSAATKFKITFTKA